MIYVLFEYKYSVVYRTFHITTLSLGMVNY